MVYITQREPLKGGEQEPYRRHPKPFSQKEIAKSNPHTPLEKSTPIVRSQKSLDYLRTAPLPSPPSVSVPSIFLSCVALTFCSHQLVRFLRCFLTTPQTHPGFASSPEPFLPPSKSPPLPPPLSAPPRSSSLKIHFWSEPGLS